MHDRRQLTVERTICPADPCRPNGVHVNQVGWRRESVVRDTVARVMKHFIYEDCDLQLNALWNAKQTEIDPSVGYVVKAA